MSKLPDVCAVSAITKRGSTSNSPAPCTSGCADRICSVKLVPERIIPNTKIGVRAAGGGVRAGAALMDELKEHVVRKIGAIARPDQILYAADLPKTRSGKIMRRLLRDIAEGKALGDTTTLADPNVVRRLKDEYESLES